MILKNRKAQASVFVIIGIIMAFVVGISYVTYNKLVSQPFEEAGLRLENYPAEIRPAVSLVDMQMKECMEEVGKDGLFLIGSQGGHIEVSEPKFKVMKNFGYTRGISEIGYGYYEGRNLMPDLDEIKEELDGYMEAFVPLCMQNSVEPLNKLSYEIEFGEIKSDVIFGDEETIFKVTYDIELSKGESMQEISEFKETSDIKFKEVYDAASLIVLKTIEEPENIDITFLNSLRYDISYIPYGENELVYVINDKTTPIDITTSEFELTDWPYTFIFANKFEFEEGFLEVDDELNATIGEKFEYTVEATRNARFFSDSNFFLIGIESGKIEFTPSFKNVGEHHVRIWAEDEAGNTDEKEVLFNINEKTE